MTTILAIVNEANADEATRAATIKKWIQMTTIMAIEDKVADAANGKEDIRTTTITITTCVDSVKIEAANQVEAHTAAQTAVDAMTKYAGTIITTHRIPEVTINTKMCIKSSTK